MKIEIRKLRKSDQRHEFDCGDAQLNRFLAHFAFAHQKRYGYSVTYVATSASAPDKILGFVTLSPGHIHQSEIPKAKLPKLPVPILRLARMGVSTMLQKQGVGRLLLKTVFNLAIDKAGCMAVIVDAKPNALSYYTKYGFVHFKEQPLNEYRELSQMYLRVKDIGS